MARCKLRGAVVAMAALAAVAIVAALAFPAGVARARSLYNEESSPFASMYADRKARQVGGTW